MAAKKEAARAGRTRTRERSARVFFRIPQGDFDYLRHVAEVKMRLGTTANDAARTIVIREVDAMRKGDYHAKEDPKIE